MIKKSLLLLLGFALTISILSTKPVLANVSSKNQNPKPIVTYAPEQPSLVNGVVEDPKGGYVPFDPPIYTDPVFVSYSPTTQTDVTYFKLIGSTYVDNRTNPNPFILKFKVERSERVGSEWSGSVKFTEEIKLGIMGKMSVEAGISVKEYREINEAVGVEGQMTVSPRKQGRLEAYYGGRSSRGSLVYDQYDSYTGKTTRYTVGVDVQVHPTQLVVNFKPNEW